MDLVPESGIKAASPQYPVGMSGEEAAAIAMADNIPLIQKYVTALFGLSSALMQHSQDDATYWLSVLSQDEKNVNTEINSQDPPKVKSDKIHALEVAYEVDDLSYEQNRSLLSQMNNTVNESSSAANDEVSLLLQLYEVGPETQAKQLAAILQNG